MITGVPGTMISPSSAWRTVITPSNGATSVVYPSTILASLSDSSALWMFASARLTCRSATCWNDRSRSIAAFAFLSAALVWSRASMVPAPCFIRSSARVNWSLASSRVGGVALDGPFGGGEVLLGRGELAFLHLERRFAKSTPAAGNPKSSTLAISVPALTHWPSLNGNSTMRDCTVLKPSTAWCASMLPETTIVPAAIAVAEPGHQGVALPDRCNRGAGDDACKREQRELRPDGGNHRIPHT